MIAIRIILVLGGSHSCSKDALMYEGYPLLFSRFAFPGKSKGEGLLLVIGICELSASGNA